MTNAKKTTTIQINQNGTDNLIRALIAAGQVSLVLIVDRDQDEIQTLQVQGIETAAALAHLNQILSQSKSKE